jgi:hypothetical protein
MTDEDDGYEYRAKRQRRATVTIAVLVLALAGAFYYASTYYREGTKPIPAACSTVVPTPQLGPAEVSVNVYNATNKQGLAGATAKDVAKRGFKVKSVANDPLKKTIKKAAEIRFGPTGAESAQLLAEHVPGAVLVEDKRKSDTIDLVLGDAWKKLGPPPPEPTPEATLPLCPGVTPTTG